LYVPDPRIASDCIGVGHCFAIGPSDASPFTTFDERFSASGAVVGVGHIRIASVSIVPGCITPVVVVPFADDLESATVAVGHTFGQEEDPLPPVRCADFRSCEQCRRNAVAQLL
jgi:hypothetical protein